jgi:hypothetical protein
MCSAQALACAALIGKVTIMLPRLDYLFVISMIV